MSVQTGWLVGWPTSSLAVYLKALAWSDYSQQTVTKWFLFLHPNLKSTHKIIHMPSPPERYKVPNWAICNLIQEQRKSAKKSSRFLFYYSSSILHHFKDCTNGNPTDLENLMCSFWHLLDLLHQQLVLVIHLLLQVYLTNLLIVDRLTLSGCTKPSGASHHITSLQTLTSDNRRMITTSLSFATHVFFSSSSSCSCCWLAHYHRCHTAGNTC